MGGLMCVGIIVLFVYLVNPESVSKDELYIGLICIIIPITAMILGHILDMLEKKNTIKESEGRKKNAG